MIARTMSKRQRHFKLRWTRLLFVFFMSASIAAWSLSLPHGKLTNAGRTLAYIQVTGFDAHVVGAQVHLGTKTTQVIVEPQGRMVPTHRLPAGRPIVVQVEVAGASWLRWLPGEQTVLSLKRQVPTDPKVSFNRTNLIQGQALTLSVDGNALNVRGQMANSNKVRLIHQVKENEDLDWGVVDHDGTLDIQTQVLPWVSWSPPQVVRWTVLARGSILRLEQLLAALKYLPVKWTARAPLPPGREGLVHAPAGSFQWRYDAVPSGLKSLWIPGRYTVMAEGAVIQFEHQHGLVEHVVPTATFWRTLLKAFKTDRVNPDGYSYAWVSENLPETFHLWRDGTVVLTSLANTAKPPGHTHVGTFPVFLRTVSQTMRGTVPATGEPYVYPNVPWVSYFKGNDAVHGFPRQAYGFPQSAGCVELPIAKAAIAYRYMHYGTLVTVSPPTG